MKRNILFFYPAIILVSLLIGSCSKKNDAAPVPTKQELLTSASWKFSTAMVGGTDVSGFLQTCQKDNILLFQAAGTGTLDEGATKCNAGDPQTNPFTWNFASSESVLHISTVLFTGGSSDFNLISVTSANLIVSQNITVSGSTQNAVVTFIH